LVKCFDPAAEKKPRAIKLTKTEGLVAALDAAEERISELDLASLSEQENKDVIKAVDSLRQTINAFFGQVGPKQSRGSA